MARWRLCLPEFEFDVVHWNKFKHQPFNAFSDIANEGANTTPVEDEMRAAVIDTNSNATD